jgi:2-dehydropantoate 2-reductase
VATIHELLGKAGPSKGSMLQDFEAGRRTEIDVINGAVVKAADEAGVEVPLNRMLVRLVKGWEAMRGLS